MPYVSTLQSRFYDRYAIKVIEPPIGEQLSLDEVRDHLRIITYESPPTFYEEDAWLQAAISTAREWCENYIMGALAPQTVELGLSSFPVNLTQSGAQSTPFSNLFTWDNGILLPMTPPLLSVVSVKFDDGGSEATLSSSDYYVDDYARPVRLYPTGSWPTAQAKRRSVRIRYRCGYALPDDSPPTPAIPFAIRAAMLLFVGHLHENRENTQEVTPVEIPLGAKSLMDRYRVRLGMA